MAPPQYMAIREPTKVRESIFSRASPFNHAEISPNWLNQLLSTMDALSSSIPKMGAYSKNPEAMATSAPTYTKMATAPNRSFLSCRTDVYEPFLPSSPRIAGNLMMENSAANKKNDIAIIKNGDLTESAFPASVPNKKLAAINGATVVPKELNACAKLSRDEADSFGPNTLT